MKNNVLRFTHRPCNQKSHGKGSNCKHLRKADLVAEQIRTEHLAAKDAASELADVDTAIKPISPK